MAVTWYVYVLLCENEHLYTGISTDVERRFKAHVAGKGARYTRSNKPVKVLGQSRCDDRSSALRREYAIKQLSAADKLSLVADWSHESTPAAESVPCSQLLPALLAS